MKLFTACASGSCYRPHKLFTSTLSASLIEMHLIQAARESQQAKAEPHTPFASPTKRLKTPSASPAVRTLVHSPDTPQRPPVRSRAARPGGGLSQGRVDVDAALAAVSAVIQGSCADEEHAQSAAAISAGERAAGKKKPGKGAAAQRAAASAGPGQTAGLEQSAQGVSTPAKQPQARQGYAAGKASARDALGAAHKAAAKRTAQVLLLCMLFWVLLSHK